MSRTALLLMLLLVATACPTAAYNETKIIIAEKSSYNLPGNSLPGIAASIAEGVELLRLSAVMTGDQKVILLDSPTLNRLTGVPELFPDRVAEDGFYYPVDFSYEDIQQLFQRQESLPEKVAVPDTDSSCFFTIPLLSDALKLIKTMAAGTNTRPGVVLEIKQNWRYLREGKDLSSEALALMARHGFVDKADGFVATHDPEELKRIHDEIMPALGMSLRTLQLIDSDTGRETMRFERGKWQPYNYDWLFTKFGLKSLSSYADAIAFPPETAITPEGQFLLSKYFEDAHLLGLQLLAFPFDQFATPLPAFSESLADLAAFCLFEAGFDGLFTGNDRMLREHLAQHLAEIEQQSQHQKTPIEILLEKAKKENGSQ